MLDDNRPILSIAEPRRGATSIDVIRVGMHDYATGLDLDSFSVVASVDLASDPAGSDLAPHFASAADGVWEWRLSEPIEIADEVTLTVSVRDRQGNTSTVERTLRPD
jgi:hypothetical protein